MAALIYLKALNILWEEEDKSFIKRTKKTHGWDVLFYIFSFLKRIMLFTQIVLTGTNWSFFKPYLQGKEKKFLIVCIPLQVLVYLSLVYICKQHIIISRWEHKPRRSIVRWNPSDFRGEYRPWQEPTMPMGSSFNFSISSSTR